MAPLFQRNPSFKISLCIGPYNYNIKQPAVKCANPRNETVTVILRHFSHFNVSCLSHNVSIST